MVNDVTLATDRVPAEQVACKRRDVLNKLQEALKRMEDAPYEFPTPKAVLRGEMCDCLKPPEHGKVTYSPTATLDGEQGVPIKLVEASSRIRWTPKYPALCQNMHPDMTCYCVPQVFNPDQCDCPEGDRYKDQYRTKTQNVGVGDKDYCTSGKDVYYCPPDSNHKHWSPHKGSCVWPRPCPASCFDHSDTKDWINVVPNYNYYMQHADAYDF
uniref:Mucin-19 n=1 Tax=Lygus hesperus TaxID=30085 RepID=A0A0A9X5E5_LYGHE